VDDHLRILEQRVQAKAIGVKRSWREGERRRGEDQQQQEKDLNASQDRRSIRGEGDIDLMPQAQDKTVAGEQPCPEDQGALLSGPQGGELVVPGECPVRVVQDVIDRVVVGEGGPDHSQCSDRHGNEAGYAGTARGLTKMLRRDGQWPVLGDSEEREAAGEQRVDAERKSK